MEIYGLPDTWRSGRLKWYCAPREAVERYLALHGMFDSIRDSVEVVAAEVKVLGGLDYLPTCEKPSHYRVLVQGNFSDRQQEFVVADAVLLGPDECYYKNLSIPPMGDGKILINALLGSDSGESEIPFDVLAQVHTYTEAADREFLALGHAPYANRAIKRLLLALDDGTTKAAYSHSVGYFEGYQYDLFASRKAAYADAYEQLRLLAKQDWTALECWECGAVYDEPGHVEPGQMGCQRCN